MPQIINEGCLLQAIMRQIFYSVIGEKMVINWLSVIVVNVVPSSCPKWWRTAPYILVSSTQDSVKILLIIQYHGMGCPCFIHGNFDSIVAEFPHFVASKWSQVVAHKKINTLVQCQSQHCQFDVPIFNSFQHSSMHRLNILWFCPFCLLEVLPLFFFSRYNWVPGFKKRMKCWAKGRAPWGGMVPAAFFLFFGWGPIRNC